MDKESRRAELEAKRKASFQLSHTSEEMELYSRFIQEVYSGQREDGSIVPLDSIPENIQTLHKLSIL